MSLPVQKYMGMERPSEVCYFASTASYIIELVAQGPPYLFIKDKTHKWFK